LGTQVFSRYFIRKSFYNFWVVEGIRSFIAIEIPGPLRARVEELQRELQRAGADVKWVRPGAIHLTLKFLGSISGEDVEKLARSLGPVISLWTPFELRIRGVGCFPSGRNPRVVWAGIKQGSVEASSLQKAVEDQATEVGFPPESRAFKPHLTLGRVRSPKGKSSLTSAIENQWDVEIGSFLASEVYLFKSELKPGGAIYTKLRTFPMGSRESADE
jgi:2'-5' RNA ligase